nr:hypothetical protein Iba_chr10aCG13150 [Ipomoea batatas]
MSGKMMKSTMRGSNQQKNQYYYELNQVQKEDIWSQDPWNFDDIDSVLEEVEKIEKAYAQKSRKKRPEHKSQWNKDVWRTKRRQSGMDRQEWVNYMGYPSYSSYSTESDTASEKTPKTPAKQISSAAENLIFKDKIPVLTGSSATTIDSAGGLPASDSNSNVRPPHLLDVLSSGRSRAMASFDPVLPAVQDNGRYGDFSLPVPRRLAMAESRATRLHLSVPGGRRESGDHRWYHRRNELPCRIVLPHASHGGGKSVVALRLGLTEEGGGGVNTAKMPRHLTRRCSVSLRPRRKRRWPLLLGAVGKNQEENTAVTAPESFYPAMAAERNLSPVNRRIEPCRSCLFRRRSFYLLFTKGERGQERASPNGPAIAVAFLGCDIHFAALLDAGRDERKGRRRDPAPPCAFGNTGEETRRHPLAAWGPPSSSQRRRRGNTSSSLPPAATTTNRRFVV